MVTALRRRNVRFEKRARECACVARLIFEAEAKASLKRRQSRVQDPKPDDLFLSRRKFLERGMDVRTSATCICLDDLRIGVKSQSNLAMAGSCGNMP